MFGFLPKFKGSVGGLVRWPWHTNGVAAPSPVETGAVPSSASKTSKLSEAMQQGSDARYFTGQLTPNLDPENEKPYWWYCPEKPQPEFPSFESIDSGTVLAELRAKVQAGTFRMIEIPANLMRVIRILGNPEFSYCEVAGLISHSPALAGEFLTVANSALYNRGVAISDLNVALTRLGHARIRTMLYINASKMALAPHPVLNDLATDIINHSYTVALIGHYLCQRFYADPDSAFLACLLHDIGKLAILKEIAEEYELPADVPFRLTEDVLNDILPPLHEEVGVFLAERWNLEPAITEAIGHHHACDEAGGADEIGLVRGLAALVQLSDTMARILGKGRWISNVALFNHPACEILGIERNQATIDFLLPIAQLADRSALERR